MSVTATDTRKTVERPSVGDRVEDTARRAAHLSHEVRLVKSIAADAIEDGVYAARRAMKSLKRGAERLEEFKDQTASTVKRRPFTALGMAVGFGLVAGMVAGAIAVRFGRRRQLRTW